MTYGEAIVFIQDVVTKTLHDRMEEIYPDMFVVANTRDPKEYRKANPCMYRWYMKISNSLWNMDIRYVDLRSEEEHDNSDYSCIERFHKDMQETDNLLKFLIENTQP